MFAKLIWCAKEKHGMIPDFTVELIAISGILQWNYQIQLPLSAVPVPPGASASPSSAVGKKNEEKSTLEKTDSTEQS